MTLSDFWNDLKNKFAPPPVYVPPYRPPVAVRPPAPIPPNAPTAIEQQPQPQAALTSSVDLQKDEGRIPGSPASRAQRRLALGAPRRRFHRDVA